MHLHVHIKLNQFSQDSVRVFDSYKWFIVLYCFVLPNSYTHSLVLETWNVCRIIKHVCGKTSRMKENDYSHMLVNGILSGHLQYYNGVPPTSVRSCFSLTVLVVDVLSNGYWTDTQKQWATVILQQKVPTTILTKNK